MKYMEINSAHFYLGIMLLEAWQDIQEKLTLPNKFQEKLMRISEPY